MQANPTVEPDRGRLFVAPGRATALLALLRHLLQGHAVTTAYELGWSTLKNGELLAAAEKQAFAVLVATDTNLKYQQNLASRRMAIVVLGTTSWPRIKAAAAVVLTAINSASPGAYTEVAVS